MRTPDLALHLLFAAAACAVVSVSGEARPAPRTPAPGEARSARGAQDQKPDCMKCRQTGKLPCPEHPRAECEWEEEVEFCSFVADCKTCGGAGFVLCDGCKWEVAADALAKKRDLVQKRKTALKTIDDSMGRPIHKAESAHMVLAWAIDKLKVDKRVLDAHELLHLYLKRMDQVHTDFRARLGLDVKALPVKPWIFVWWLPEDQITGSSKFCGQNSPMGIKLLGPTPRYSVLGNRQHFRGDEQLHRNLVHSVTHLLLASEAPAIWIGNIKGGWADEGLAHWFEDRYWGICDNFCYQEQNTNVDFKGGKWRPAVRKMVADKDTPPIAELVQLNGDSLSLPQNAIAFSYVDYLLFKDGAKFNALVKLLKAKVATRDALQKTFDINLLDFEAQWKAWVLETYPTR
jgi:hypothetical protein